MSLLSDKIKSDIIALHIIDEGVSVFSERLSPLFNIDDMLVVAFISALYSYTFAIGKEYIESIDFDKCKFIFRKLYDGKLLVLITKGSLTEEQENKLLKEIELKYEIKTDEMDISELDSLLKKEESILPIEVIAEIKRKKRAKKIKIKEKGKLSTGTLVPSEPPLTVPKVKIEEFYIDIIGKEFCRKEALLKLKQVLSNFFLGYSELYLIVCVLKKEENPVTIVFGRVEEKELEDVLHPIFQYVHDKNVSKTKEDLIEIQSNEKKLWLKINVFNEHRLSIFVLGKEKRELLELTPHIKRISKFLSSIL